MNRNVGLILATVFVLFAVQTMVSVLVPLVASGTGYGTTTIGILVAIPVGVGLATDIPFAKLSDVFGRRPAIIAGAAFGATAAVVFVSGSSLVVLVVGSILLGLALSMAIGPALAFVTEAVHPEQHARIQGFNGAVQGLSALLGAAAVGVLATSAGPALAFLCTAGLWAVAIVLALPIRERPRGGRLALPAHPVGAIVKPYVRVLRLLRHEPRMVMAGTAALLYGLQFLTVGNAFVPVFLVGTGGYSGADAGLLLGARSLVAALASLSFGFTVRRIGMVKSVVVPNAIGIVGLGLVPLLAGSPLLLLAFVLQGIGVAFGPATVNLLITTSTSDSERALGFSAMNVMARTAGVLIPLVLGVAASVGGFTALFTVTEIIGALMIASLILLARRSGRIGKPVLIPG